jgi:hypothetical protein
MILKKSIIIFSISILVLIAIGFALSINSNKDPIAFDSNDKGKIENVYALDSILKVNKSELINEIIDPAIYIQKTDLLNVSLLKQNVDKSLSISHIDSMEVYKFFIRSIYQAYLNKNKLTAYKPSELLNRISFAEKLKIIGAENELYGIYMLPISDLYFQSVSEDLEKFQAAETDLVNNFDYQYLVQRCTENQYLPNRKEKNIDKFLKTYIESDYFHLINTTVNKTSIFQKLFILAFFSIWLIGLYFSIKFVIHLIYPK